MEFLPKLAALAPSCKVEIIAAYKRLQACEVNSNSIVLSEQKEKFADLLNQSGLHSESREYYYDLVHNSTSLINKSRVLRKISSSHTAQREYLKAQQFAEEALALLRLADENNINDLDLFEALTACAYSNYFIAKEARLKELVKEMRGHFPSITDKAVRLRFYFVIMLDILLRYRWYMLPEESITHGEFYLQFAIETTNWNAVGIAYNSLGFAHLWREEYDLARQKFEEALRVLQNRNFDMVLLSQVYMTVSYRMQNNITMTEKWASISMDVARQNDNKPYIGLTYGNLAWIYAKRSNWLYAEDLARKGIEMLKPYRQPMLWLCIFPLLECLYKDGNYEEAGMYCYILTHPSFKGLPPMLSEKIMRMNVAWVDKQVDEMAFCLEDVVFEAKLKNYF